VTGERGPPFVDRAGQHALGPPEGRHGGLRPGRSRAPDGWRSLVALPKWRPDTRAVVFVSYRQRAAPLQIDVGSSGERLVGGGQSSTASGRPSNGLLVTREGGGSDVSRRPGPDLEASHRPLGVDVAWAPDGRRFALLARSGTPQIYAMNLDGRRRRVSQRHVQHVAAWSPKGDLLAWTTRAGGGFQILVADVDGSRAKTNTAAGSNENPAWGPDGRYLVFSSTRAGRASLVLADRDGRTQKQLTRGAGDDTSPTWSRRLE
jgi:TolB protein